MTSPSSKQDLSEEISSNSDVEKKKKNFFISTYDELKLVVWPNKQQLFSESVINAFKIKSEILLQRDLNLLDTAGYAKILKK